MKYYGKDPIKKILSKKEYREKLFKILFIINIWVWLAVFIGGVIFILYIIFK